MNTKTDMDDATRKGIRDIVYGFFAEECDADPAELKDETRIVEDLQGDSLMLLSLLEQVRKRYDLKVELKTLGRHLMKKPASTIGQVVHLTLAVVQYGDDILHVDL